MFVFRPALESRGHWGTDLLLISIDFVKQTRPGKPRSLTDRFPCCFYYGISSNLIVFVLLLRFPQRNCQLNSIESHTRLPSCTPPHRVFLKFVKIPHLRTKMHKNLTFVKRFLNNGHFIIFKVRHCRFQPHWFWCRSVAKIYVFQNQWKMHNSTRSYGTLQMPQSGLSKSNVKHK